MLINSIKIRVTWQKGTSGRSRERTSRGVKIVSVTGANRLREWFSCVGTRDVRVKWPLIVDCLATKKSTLGMQKSCLLVFVMQSQA